MYCILDECVLSCPTVQYFTICMCDSDAYMVQIVALELIILNGNA